MFKYYLKLTLRNLQGNKLTKGVKIIGMALAIAVSMIIFLFVHFEQNYNRFFSNSENVYRIKMNYIRIDRSGNFMFRAPAPMADEIKQNFPEIKETCRIHQVSETSVSYGESMIISENALWVENNFFKIYNVKVETENYEKLLINPGSIVLSKSTSVKLFGKENPIGKTVIIGDRKIFTVTGVFEDFPAASTMKPEMVMNNPNHFNSPNYYIWSRYQLTMVLLNPETNVNNLNKKISRLVADKVKYTQGYSKWDFELQPVTEIHIQESGDYTRQGERIPSISKKTLNLLIAVALFVMLIAWLNHVNLSTNIRLKQIKQNSIDKVFGMKQNQQFYKILTETFGDFFFSFVLAVFLLLFFIPQINQLLEKEIQLFAKPIIWLVFILGLILLASITTLFESTIVSRVKFTNALKGQLGKKQSGKFVKNMVMISQYTMAVVIIFFSVIVFIQTRHMINLDIGWEQDKILIVQSRLLDFEKPGESIKKQLILNELQKLPEVQSVTFTNVFPRRDGYYTATSIGRMDQPEENYNYKGFIQTDTNFLETFGVTLLAGENIKPTVNDSIGGGILLTEQLTKEFGFNNSYDAIGSYIGRLPNKEKYRVVGIVEDMRASSLYGNNQGIAIIFKSLEKRYLAVKYNSKNPNTLVNKTRDIWNKVFNDQPFNYFYLNDSYRQIFKSELIQRRMLLLFALTAVLIACFGLFAMAFETIVQRTKEIGIRKVNGARIRDILGLLFSNYLRIILISMVPGLALAHFFSSRWLEGYANKISVSWYYFFIPVIVIAFVTIVSVMYHSFKAAISNPIEALKYE